MEEKLEKQLCPLCGRNCMNLVGLIMVCSLCKLQIPFLVYLVSLEIMLKLLLTTLLKLFIDLGVGKIIKHKGSTFVVGLDLEGLLFTLRYLLNHDEGEEVGMYVSLRILKGE